MKKINIKYLLGLMIFLGIIFYIFLFYFYESKYDRVYLIIWGLRYFIINLLFLIIFIISLFNFKAILRFFAEIFCFNIVYTIASVFFHIYVLTHKNSNDYISAIIFVLLFVLIYKLFQLKQNIFMFFLQVLIFLIYFLFGRYLLENFHLTHFIILSFFQVLSGYICAQIIILSNKWILKKDIRKELRERFE